MCFRARSTTSAQVVPAVESVGMSTRTDLEGNEAAELSQDGEEAPGEVLQVRRGQPLVMAEDGGSPSMGPSRHDTLPCGKPVGSALALAVESATKLTYFFTAVINNMYRSKCS